MPTTGDEGGTNIGHNGVLQVRLICGLMQDSYGSSIRRGISAKCEVMGFYLRLATSKKGPQHGQVAISTLGSGRAYPMAAIASVHHASI